MIKYAPICKAQQQDIREEDFVNWGLVGTPFFRYCKIDRHEYRVDKFTEYAKEILGVDANPLHFIAQVYGCTLDCPYCYVTKEGIWGSYNIFDNELVSTVFQRARVDRNVNVFHLMGGAPALYLSDWFGLLSALPTDIVFHSDFLLNEGLYNLGTLKAIASHPVKSLFAVSFKNENTPLTQLQIRNYETLVHSGLNFYCTFTGMSDELIEKNVWSKIQKHKYSYKIDITDYKALHYNN